MNYRSPNYKKYTEEFKKNVIAVYKTGMAVESIARRLGIPRSSIKNWVHDSRYCNVEPASSEMLVSLPADPLVKAHYHSDALPVAKQEDGSTEGADNLVLVRIGSGMEERRSPAKISYGKLLVEFPEGIGSSDLAKVIEALGGRDAL